MTLVLPVCGRDGMVDIPDLKSVGPCARVGSTPTARTKSSRKSTYESAHPFQLNRALSNLVKKLRFVRLELSFSTKEVRPICKNRNSAVKKLGSECARFLHDRLADIDRG